MWQIVRIEKSDSRYMWQIVRIEKSDSRYMWQTLTEKHRQKA